MRFKSIEVGGYRVFAVTGTNTVSFAIDARAADTRGLLGFAVERSDPTEDERYYMYGFKVFASLIPHPGSRTVVSTYEHPIQSFVWDDFTAIEGRRYEYRFHPLSGRPKNIDRSARPVPIVVHTEPLFSKQEHDIFFNRGVASSQAYAREFDNIAPDELEPARRDRARQWLSRALDEALLKFIAGAAPGDALSCCFYEFRYEPVARALRAAIERGVDVRIIVDAKENGSDGTPSFPREDNLEMLARVGIPDQNVVLRTAKPNEIAHNKFMVRLEGSARKAVEVWTGSTNISDGGIHGQTNVGHWVRNAEVAAHFKRYWELLATDPGPKRAGDDSRQKNKEFRSAVERLLDVPTAVADIATGVTPIFSPRSGSAVLDLYARMVDGAEQLSCITLAFGIAATFKELLKDNDARSHIAFFLLEKEDKPRAEAAQAFIQLDARNNVYKAWGSYLRDPLYQWTRETNARALSLNQHVSYIHSKFLLRDPLGDDPIVVTGSANFSAASTNDNDENMLVIRGNRRVADIYFTEFNRLFNHYYFRSVQEALRGRGSNPSDSNPSGSNRADSDGREQNGSSLFLEESDRWLSKYEQGSLRQKRVEIVTGMTGFTHC